MPAKDATGTCTYCGEYCRWDDIRARWVNYLTGSSTCPHTYTGHSVRD